MDTQIHVNIWISHSSTRRGQLLLVQATWPLLGRICLQQMKWRHRSASTSRDCFFVMMTTIYFSISIYLYHQLIDRPTARHVCWWSSIAFLCWIPNNIWSNNETKRNQRASKQPVDHLNECCWSFSNFHVHIYSCPTQLVFDLQTTKQISHHRPSWDGEHESLSLTTIWSSGLLTIWLCFQNLFLSTPTSLFCLVSIERASGLQSVTSNDKTP